MKFLWMRLPSIVKLEKEEFLFEHNSFYQKKQTKKKKNKPKDRCLSSDETVNPPFVFRFRYNWNRMLLW